MSWCFTWVKGTLLGPGGMTLSGGQRQRIGLARAFFGTPKILVLDEPNSNLDAEGDAALERALQQAKAEHITVVMVTQRKTSADKLDSLMIIRDGQIEDYGPREIIVEKQNAKLREFIHSETAGSRASAATIADVASDWPGQSGKTAMSAAYDYSEWAKDVPTSTRKIAWVSYGTVAAFLLAFGIWGVKAPLDGAAIASGVIAAAGKNLSIQHLEGGNIEEVLVHEGERVKAGTPLYRLDQTVPQTQLNRLTKAKSSFQARAERLKAERDGKTELVFAPELKNSTDPDIVEIISEQANDFITGLRRHQSEISILQQRVSALEESISGLDAQKKAADDQLAIVGDEIARKKKLLDKGLTDRSQFTALMRNQAELLGQIGSVTSNIASAKTQIGEAKQQIERATTQRIEQASKDLTDVRRQETDFNEQITAAKSVLARTVVSAPVDGIVIRMVINSKGSVVRPGETLLELLPTTSDLIVEAKMDPRQVDAIRIGQDARLRFIALNARSTPEVAGRVTFISPDSFVDEATRQAFYAVRLRIEKLPPEIAEDQVFPGMPVEVFISTGDRTFAEYLARPITDSFSRAFREE